jgi:hypothetical protein
MLAGSPLSVASPPPLARVSVSRGPLCPHCDAPRDLSATLCGYCGVTLGEPPRRSGVTQRAVALDAEAARLALEARAPSPPIVVAIAPPKPRAATSWERLFVVLTLGLGWIWVRRRLALG